MKQLGMIAPGVSQSLVPSSDAPSKSVVATRMLMARRQRSKPPTMDRIADIEIPRKIWSSWIEAGQARKLRRPLTESEYTAVEKRRDELAPWVCGYHPEEMDDVALALIDLFTGMASANTTAEAGSARVDSVAQLLMEFPAWAIEGMSRKVRTRGYVRDGKIERHWAPADPEIIDLVKAEVALYGPSYDNAVAMLTAEVADD